LNNSACRDWGHTDLLHYTNTKVRWAYKII